MQTAKQLLAVFLLAVSLAAAQDTVYVSRSGRSYHSTAQCYSLSRSKTVSAITLDEAQKRGLKACRICVRTKGEAK